MGGEDSNQKRTNRLQDVQFDAFLEHDYQDDTIGDLEDKITIEGLAEQIDTLDAKYKASRAIDGNTM